MAQGVACKKNLDTNEAFSISLDTHIKRLEKKIPNIVIPFIVRVIILASICFLFFFDQKHGHEKYSSIGTTISTLQNSFVMLLFI